MVYLKLAAVLVALAALVGPLPPSGIERWYSAGLYAWFQPAVTGASSLVPVALLDVAIAVLLLTAVLVLVRRWRAAGAVRALGRSAVSLAVLASAIYLWFLLAWGLNYRRVPLEQKLAYDASLVTPPQAAELARQAVHQMNALVDASVAFTDEAALGSAFLELQGHLGARRAPRLALPKPSVLWWYFRYAAIDGLTNPFFLEIIVHPDLLPFERPFVLAHEWSHLAGYADEAEANFLAWLTCLRSTPRGRYSGWIVAYQHLIRQVPREVRQQLQAELSPLVVADLTAARQRVARASPVISTAARGAYDAYLRANRVDEGIASYGGVVRLMLGTRFEPDWTPVMK